MWEGLMSLFQKAPEIINAVSDSGSAMSEGGLSLMGEGANAPMTLGSGDATSSGLGSLGSGMAPELGGQTIDADPLSGLGAQGGLMDAGKLMASTGQGGQSQGNKYQNEMVNKYVQMGLQSDKPQQNGLMELMNLSEQYRMGGRNG